MINNLVPTEFYMGQNYPNPFKDKTTIKYCVADKTRVQITVYDAEGTEIEKLVDEVKEPGTYEVEFSICHSRKSAIGGEHLPAANQGLPDAYYYYRMTAGDYISDKKWLCINKLSGRFGMKTFLLVLFVLLFISTIDFAQVREFESYRNSPPKIITHEKTARWPAQSFYQRKSDWQWIVDSTWGPGASTAQKLQIFNTYANLIHNKFTLFYRLNLDWDSLRTFWSSQN